jgi:zinc protease
MTVRFEASGDGTAAFVEESRALPLVSIVIALRSGSAHDPLGKEGLSRITARLLRRGCEGQVSREIDDAIDRLGSEMSVDVSASQITLHTQVIRRNLDAFVKLLSRLLGTPTFPEEELDRMKRETAAEIIEARDSDRALAQIAFRRALFAGHLYGRAAVGTVKSVPTITRDDVLAHYAKHFVRGNVVIGFAGDIEEKEARPIVDQLVSGLSVGKGIDDPVPPPPEPKGRHLVFVDKPDRTQTQILIGTLGT